MSKLYFFTSILFILFVGQIYGQVDPFSVSANDSSICEGQTVTISVQGLPGTITTLTCASATNNGTLVTGAVASGVSSSIPYTGGNGGLHNGQTITSTGVTGLTATLTSSVFNNGIGNLTYTITGTPSATGTASFALNIGGQTCILTRTVVPGSITSLTCASATNNGTLIAGAAASGVNSVVPYTGGNGGTHNGQTVNSTGITGLTATLSAGSFANGSGSLTYIITGTPSGIGTANFALNIGGQTCILTRTVVPSSITSLTCASATNNGTLIAGAAASGVNSVVPYTGGNGGTHNGQTVNSTGITGLTATLSAGSFANGSGSLTYIITGTPSGIGTANFALNIGGQTCTISRTINIAGTITALTCASATNNGTIIAGVVVSGVSSSIPYTGGNGGSHYGQVVTSTGVTGLTATLLGGSFANGVGSVTYTITGTPNTAGTASFNLSIGGRTCTLTRSVECWSLTNTTTVVDVVNPTTGKTWMDRNLGAVRQATSSTDVFSYGDVYQWGRRSDGHQCRTSTTTTTLSSSDIAANSSFIVVTSTNPGDWRSPQNNNLWQGVNGINNPCPSGFRVPTFAELNAEATTWTVANAFSSVLKLPAAGGRLSVTPNNGTLASAGVGGVYWTSTISGTTSRNVSFGTLDAGLTAVTRSDGMSVRCIKETLGTIGSLNCGSSALTGNLISNVAASNVSVTVPYTLGSGGYYAAQNIGSTGVTGLTATITQGLFATGAGNLVYTITGTPASSGTANFAITIGGQSCTLNLTVVTNPTNQYPVGSVFCNEPTLIVDVTNPTTGKTWMNRNLGATRVATSSTDVNAYGDLHQWGRRSDGHQCKTSSTTGTLSSVDVPANGLFIIAPSTPFDWRSPQNTNLWQGVNGTNNPCPSGYRLPTETELNTERLTWSSSTAAGAFASPLKLSMAGFRLSGNGSLGFVGTLGFYWSSTVSTTLSRYLNFDATTSSMNTNNRAVGGTVRCIKETVGSIGALNCGSSTVTGNLISGSAASSVSASVPYTGGNGGFYNSQTVNSTGVTGLIATISQGLFTSSTGNLVYTITGTPASSGTANFALTIGGQSCTLNLTVIPNPSNQYPSGTVFCNEPTLIVDVTNPTTGKTWMDRNLGATQAATSSTDANAYGDFYQWGRRSDGHQCRTSATTSTLSSIDVPINGNYILPSGSPNDWRNPQNNNLWQGISGTNNPCPTGYRLPTETEINAERLSWSQNNRIGAFASLLKLPSAGFRSYNDGSLGNVDTYGYYWSSTVNGVNSRFLSYLSNNANIGNSQRAFGLSVRCIKEYTGTIGTLDCGSTIVTGNLFLGTAASGVSASVPYTGGNGGFYNGQTVNSTGVTGLTATLNAGNFADGAGNLVYTISGTPASSGIANFDLIIGGQSCTLSIIVYGVQPSYPVGSVFCGGITTIVNDVTNPTTGKTWMDRNLGATQAATSSTNVPSYGDLYQWGRRSDGHQCRTSATTSTLSSIDVPANGNFILATSTPNDWRSPQNTNLWQGINGTNNPCPTGYRLPSETELNAERLSWSQNNSFGAFASVLKWSLPGSRNFSNGTFANVGTFGTIWSSRISNLDSYVLSFSTGNASLNIGMRAYGSSIRCIKEYNGTMGALNCGGTVVTGNLISGTAASGVSASVPYTGGNGGYYAAQSVTSTGVSGLTATLTAGNLANGTGNLIYVITGTPASSGTTSFAFTIGGQNCTLNLMVVPNPTNQYPSGTVFCIEPTLIVDVTNPTTGKTWMDRNLGATQAATSSTDASSYGDLYQWGRRSDGHQCRTSVTTTTLSSIDVPANGNYITASTGNKDWRNPQNTNLWQAMNGVNNPCPTGYRLPTDTELIAERLSWSSLNSSGAYSSPLKLPMAGYRLYSDGSLNSVGAIGSYWSSTVQSVVSRSTSFTSSIATIGTSNRADGYSVRCIKEYSASIGTLDCGSAIITGNLISGTAATTVSASVPYTGGNGGYYAAQSLSSTGVTGLTATLSLGNIANGSGNLVYTITGTPSASGTASFAISIGGQSCNLSIIVYGVQPTYPTGAVFCNGATIVNDVTNPATGKIWMDRNLGATRAATSSTDANAYGDLYQWGRGIDGHQCRNSTTSSTLSPSDQPGINRFIINSTNPSDWRNPQNTNLWQSVNGINNPCPNGYRVPTSTEIDTERLSWSANNSVGAYASPLKLPLAGGRLGSNGQLYDVGTGGVYWSSTVSTTNANYLVYGASSAGVFSTFRTSGYSIRCIKETVGSIGALNCGSATVTGNLISGTAASSVSASVPYSGGNGGFYNGQTVNSTGVTGLTATISQGLFTSSTGSLVYTITGTPSASGTASFAISIGGQSCNLSIIVYGVQPTYPTGAVFCNGATIVNDVTNPATGKTWMDRNLGASQAATSSTDVSSYGDLYQWGRRSDGHQCRTSGTTATLSSIDVPANGNFILPASYPGDWRSPQNSNLWQGLNGTNNPCPTGYRLPTETEIDAERLSWSVNTSVGAFASPLKLSMSGLRSGSNGSLFNVGTIGRYWNSTVSSNSSSSLVFSSSDANLNNLIRAGGFSVRCLKD